MPLVTRVFALVLASASSLLSVPSIFAQGQSHADVAHARALVDFDFEEEVATGPYTVSVFENAQGSVAISEEYAYGGSRSVEVRDTAGDGEFAEMLGFFPQVSAGLVSIRFALLVAEPGEPFNVAIAGPAHFTMSSGGMAFWLQGRDGQFLVMSDREVRHLAPIEPYAWYAFDIVYDVAAGTYDLLLTKDGEEGPVVAVAGQKNATGSADSPIDRFSFIGDVPWEDGSNARFFVDDVFVEADGAASPGPFVAPGRRMLFVDIWDHYAREMAQSPECPPVLSLDDFGIDDIDRGALADAGRLAAVNESLGKCGYGSAEEDALVSDDLQRRVDGVELWRRGCDAPAGCGEPCAVDLFLEAAALVPDAKIHLMSAVLALGTAGRWDEADELLVTIHPDWRSDPRFPSISAALGMARGDLESAEVWLAAARDDEPPTGEADVVRRLWSGELGPNIVDELRRELPGDWRGQLETVLTVEQRYHVLLWQERFAEARSYAERVEVRLEALDLDSAVWAERAGDAAFRDGDHHAARIRYESILESPGRRTAALLKLSDVHFALGDHELERAYRERVYGSLDPKDTRLPSYAPGLDRNGPETCPTYR